MRVAACRPIGISKGSLNIERVFSFSISSHSQFVLSIHSRLLEEIMAHQQFQSCIEACNACAEACDYCAVSCLQEPDPKAMARCIALDMDCAQICRLAAGYMSRGSELAGTICQVCAKVCEACGDECAKYQVAHCQECAQACRRCADECRRMAGMKPGQQRGAGAGATAH
jgi:hypothetical protein